MFFKSAEKVYEINTTNAEIQLVVIRGGYVSNIISSSRDSFSPYMIRFEYGKFTYQLGGVKKLKNVCKYYKKYGPGFYFDATLELANYERIDTVESVSGDIIGVYKVYSDDIPDIDPP